jgi:hypothetical protein
MTMKERERLRLAVGTFLFLPIIVFAVGSLIISLLITPIPLYQDYFVMAQLYLIILAFIFLGIFYLLTKKSFDPVFVTFFIGVACTITLNALWGGWHEMGGTKITWPGGIIVANFAYWGMQFFFTAMIPILIYIGIKLYAKEVAFSYGYLFGLMIVGIGTYITWSLLNEFGIFFIWGLENFTPEIATWFPANMWFLGVPWMFWTAPLTITIIIIGYLIMRRYRKKMIAKLGKEYPD